MTLKMSLISQCVYDAHFHDTSEPIFHDAHDHVVTTPEDEKDDDHEDALPAMPPELCQTLSKPPGYSKLPLVWLAFS